jgi:hypothetical protein
MERINTTLVEPGVKYFISCSLRQCREFKDKYINILFNIGMFALFIIIISGILVYKYKGKMTPIEREIINRKKQEYIVSKLQQIAVIKKQNSEMLITNLPNWTDHPELSILRSTPKY